MVLNYYLYDEKCSLLKYNYDISVLNDVHGSVAKASDTQAVGHGFDPRPDH